MPNYFYMVGNFLCSRLLCKNTTFLSDTYASLYIITQKDVKLTKFTPIILLYMMKL